MLEITIKYIQNDFVHLINNIHKAIRGSNVITRHEATHITAWCAGSLHNEFVKAICCWMLEWTSLRKCCYKPSGETGWLLVHTTWPRELAEHALGEPTTHSGQWRSHEDKSSRFLILTFFIMNKSCSDVSSECH